VGTNHIAHKTSDTAVHILAYIAIRSNEERLTNAGIYTGGILTVMAYARYGTRRPNKHAYMWCRRGFVRPEITYLLIAGKLAFPAEITLFRIKSYGFHRV
jgi:hypothetical protein